MSARLYWPNDPTVMDSQHPWLDESGEVRYERVSILNAILGLEKEVSRRYFAWRVCAILLKPAFGADRLAPSIHRTTLSLQSSPTSPWYRPRRSSLILQRAG